MCVCERVCMSVCVSERERETERGCEAISSLYFLDIQSQSLCVAVFFIPLPRRGNRGGIIASEFQKYRLPI